MTGANHFWRPEGKTNKDIVASLIAEARARIAEFLKVESRHSAEIIEYYAKSGRRPTNEELEIQILGTLFELGGPETFDFEFHELRRSYLNH